MTGAMNRAQRRLGKPRQRRADGIASLRRQGMDAIGAMLGQQSSCLPFLALDAVTGRRMDEPGWDLGSAIADSPFKTLLTLRWPATIKETWYVPEGWMASIPPELFAELAAALAAGDAILLVSPCRKTRDRAKRVLFGMLAAPSGRSS